MASSSKSVLRQTLLPVTLVVVLWVTMSSATTYYVQWLERSHQRILAEDIVSIRAAEMLQIMVWKLAAELPDDAKMSSTFRNHWVEIEGQIKNQRQKLANSAFTEAERHIVLKLDSSVAALLHNLHQAFDTDVRANGVTPLPIDMAHVKQQAIENAYRIETSTNELLKINQELADKDIAQRARIGRVIYAARLTMLVIGPLLGVFLGWRLGRLLYRSIARIAVTLHDASASGESDVGLIAIEASGDVRDVQQQAEKVAEKMRQVSRDLQTARREVLQSERLAAVGELAAGVAHEIRNPLTSVKLLLQHAIRQASGPTLDQNKLQLILEEIGRMEKTIQGLLDFSRPPTLNRVPHDLRQTIRRALNLVDARARQERIEIVWRASDVPLMVDGDTEKLHQVLVNLLINAIEAMTDGGRLIIDADVRMRRKSPDEVNSSIADSNIAMERMAQITIQDTGRGIPEDLLPRLFEPFATSKERGTGLGLAVSRRIVEEHHGSILACNLPTGGAQFTLVIPTTEFNDNSMAT